MACDKAFCLRMHTVLRKLLYTYTHYYNVGRSHNDRKRLTVLIHELQDAKIKHINLCSLITPDYTSINGCVTNIYYLLFVWFFKQPEFIKEQMNAKFLLFDNKQRTNGYQQPYRKINQFSHVHTH